MLLGGAIMPAIMAKKKKPSRKPKGKIPPPACKALLLCDQTIIEAGSGKISLIGSFTAFALQSFPGQTVPFTAFVQLADGIGRYEIQVEIHDLREGTVLARSPKMEIEFAERLTKINICLPVPPLRLTHEGKYDFVFLANGQEIDRQQFDASSQENDENA
jgi:hypothetical protein